MDEDGFWELIEAVPDAARLARLPVRPIIGMD
jgi:hypothetical protein